LAVIESARAGFGEIALSRRPAISGRAEKVILGADEEAKKITERLAARNSGRVAQSVDGARHKHPSAHVPRRARTAPGVSGRRTRSLEFRAARARTRTNDRARRSTRKTLVFFRSETAGSRLVI